MKKQVVAKVKAPKGMFDEVQVGMQGFNALKHKNGSRYSDVEYMELLGRHCIKKEQDGQPYLYDRDVVNVAKEIVKGRDNGMTTAELNKYLQSCLNFN